MSEENTPQAPSTTSNGTSNGAQMPHQQEKLVPSFRLAEAISAKRKAEETATTAAQQIADLQAKLEAANNQLLTTQTSHQQEMHLIEKGFNAPSVRRFFRREYQAAVSELPGDQRPGFDAWLDANREDPLYSVHFDRIAQPTATAPNAEATTAPATATPAPAANDQLQTLIAALTGNPNAGASQPADNRAKEWTPEEIRKVKARHNGTLGPHAEEIKAYHRAKSGIK